MPYLSPDNRLQMLGRTRLTCPPCGKLEIKDDRRRHDVFFYSLKQGQSTRRRETREQ
jgi:hypothetical protein